MKAIYCVLILITLMFSGCTGGSKEPLPPSEPQANEIPGTFTPVKYELVQAYPSLTLKEPLAVVYDNVGQLYVVERRGLIHSIPEKDTEKSAVLLDLTSVVDTSGQEMGLLGLAFHPDYGNNGYFYVNYTKDSKTFISRFERNKAGSADLNTEKVLLTYNQPYKNHNGGTLLFGNDGYLYIAAGDGGSAGDPQGNAQNLSSYLGKILRIDVNSDSLAYLIPDDNPFVATKGALPEIYAYGLRNPWKFSFDKARDILVAADVGQDTIEEIDIIEKGKNYGWNILEGSFPYNGSSVSLEGYVLPVYEYNHKLGESITGGFTYYGKENPSLTGAYIYGDFISGKIWALWLEKGMKAENYELLSTDLLISSFGIDGAGEIIVVDFRGKLYRLKELN